MILVETGIFSLAFRRKRRNLSPAEIQLVYALEELFKEGLAVTIGLIRQELLSGIASEEQFAALKLRLHAIEDLPVETDTFVLAADFFNRCRRKGIAPGDIDMTICAASFFHGCDIYTTDPGFPRYASVLPLRLFQP